MYLYRTASTRPSTNTFSCRVSVFKMAAQMLELKHMWNARSRARVRKGCCFLSACAICGHIKSSACSISSWLRNGGRALCTRSRTSTGLTNILFIYMYIYSIYAHMYFEMKSFSSNERLKCAAHLFLTSARASYAMYFN